MMETRKLTREGMSEFRVWLENPVGYNTPAEIERDMVEPFDRYVIDPERRFGSRYEFGVYLNDQFRDADFNNLMSPECDGLWAWLAIVYFNQLTANGIRREEHYVVMRKGSAGALAYRHAVRTSYELVYVHNNAAQICLSCPMDTWGELAEQMTSRQTLMRNPGFFKTAFVLYMSEGRLRRGAASRPRERNGRNPRDRTGLGGIRRLAVALQRLDLTYDTEEMNPEQIKKVLPQEFSRWT